MTANTLTQSIVRELLYYNADTGAFFWRERKRHWFLSDPLQRSWNTANAGAFAGSISKRGYLKMTILGDVYSAHRVAWLYVYGSWPTKAIDHINHNKIDNRISNLRDVTGEENSRNMAKMARNTSGKTGVCWNKAIDKWISYISFDNKQRFLGNYTNLEDAIAARVAAEKQHNYHPNHGLS